MKMEARKLLAVAATIALWMVITASLYAGPLAAQQGAVARVAISLATAGFALLCLTAGGAIVAAAYFLYKMANSPKPGLTVFDARITNGKSIFSDRYLNADGVIARRRLYISIICFVSSWICALIVVIVMYHFFYRAH